MTMISIRGVSDKSLARLKSLAQREGLSLNALAVRALEAEAGTAAPAQPPKAFDDLDALAGTWKAADAKAFESATAPFGEVDDALWK